MIKNVLTFKLIVFVSLLLAGLGVSACQDSASMQRFKTNQDTVLVDNFNTDYAYVLDTVIESSSEK